MKVTGLGPALDGRDLDIYIYIYIYIYIENAHISTLTSIAQEAAAGRTIKVVRTEHLAMQAL
jgi:hypothetical protein